VFCKQIFGVKNYKHWSWIKWRRITWQCWRFLADYS